MHLLLEIDAQEVGVKNLVGQVVPLQVLQEGLLLAAIIQVELEELVVLPHVLREDLPR